jgi:TPR repeat protein
MYGLCWKSMRSLGLTSMFVVAFATPLTVSATDAPPASQSASSVPSDADLASTKCAIGEERIVPGDYYYCIAEQTYGEQRYEYAQKFFTTAASWASKPAQYVLGVMAMLGDHQPVNRPLGLAWLALAAERPQSTFESAYKAAYAKVTAADRKAAEQLLTTMRPIYGDAKAAPRAEERYAQGMAQLRRVESMGGNYCMEGVSTSAQSSMAPDPSQCPPIQVVVSAVDKAAANVFDGWKGHVTVGPLQPVAAPTDATPSVK